MTVTSKIFWEYLNCYSPIKARHDADISCLERAGYTEADIVAQTDKGLVGSDFVTEFTVKE